MATLSGHENWVYSLAFSTDGRLLASGGWDGSLNVWDWRTQTQLAAIAGHDDIILAVTFSPDGNCLASAGYDQVVKLWDVER